MEKFIHNGTTYEVEERNGKRFFYKSGVALSGIELNVVRNRYDKEHPMYSASNDDNDDREKRGWRTMKTNEYILAATNADFLNKLLGLRLKGWMRSSRAYDEKLIWMVFFDEKDRGGWRNHFLSEDECCQFNADHKKEWDGARISESLRSDRITFEIIECGTVRKYVFRGIFRYEASKSDPQSHVYFQKISDTFSYYRQ